MIKNIKIALAADHGGFELKKKLMEFLTSEGINFEDLGSMEYDQNDDYPDLAAKISIELSQGKIDKGILICGSGVGACIAANKFKNVRASVCHDTYSAHQGVEHDNMNLLCLGGRVIGDSLAKEIVNAFIHAGFSNEERHLRRLSKINTFIEINFR